MCSKFNHPSQLRLLCEFQPVQERTGWCKRGISREGKEHLQPHSPFVTMNAAFRPFSHFSYLSANKIQHIHVKNTETKALQTTLSSMLIISYSICYLAQRWAPSVCSDLAAVQNTNEGRHFLNGIWILFSVYSPVKQMFNQVADDGKSSQSVNVVSGLTRSVGIAVAPKNICKQKRLFKTLLSALAWVKIRLQVSSRMSLRSPIQISDL